MRKPRLIYYHDSRHYLMYRYDPPLSLHRLQQPVDDMLGTGVDTLSFGLASGTTFLHDTKVGNKWGDSVVKHNHGVMWWRAMENLRQALRAGHDPLKVVVDRAHEKGMQVYCSLRMNDPASPHTDANLYFSSKIKEEHPEVMIGEEDPDKPGAATCLNFALPEVRQERLAVIEEVCDRYGADGLEMDQYLRVFFKRSEARQNVPVLTEFVREVRDLLDRIGAKRGTRLCLSARVHPVEEANLNVGMDVRAWLSEKLVDLVVPQSENTMLDPDPAIGWLAEAAHDAGAWVYTPVGEVPYDDRYHRPTIEMFRAVATNYRVAGADGLYLSNLPWPHGEAEYMVLREMGDPDIYARKAKHYILPPGDPGGGPFTPKRYLPKRHLPVTLEQGTSARVPIFVGDALDSARADGEFARAVLAVRVVQTGPNDQLTFRLNGQQLPLDSARINTYYGGLVPYTASRSGMPERINTHYWFEFDLPPDLLQEGANELVVTMDRRFDARLEDRVLLTVEVRIAYKEAPMTTGGQM